MENVYKRTKKISAPCHYSQLIDALDIWQEIFELALDKSAEHLDQEQLPAQDLRSSLTEMCDLLRDVLANSVPLHGNKAEESDDHAR